MSNAYSPGHSRKRNAPGRGCLNFTGIYHIGEINGGRAAAGGSINHLAESGIFVPLSAGLDHEVGEPAVEDGIKGIDVNLVEALTPC